MRRKAQFYPYLLLLPTFLLVALVSVYPVVISCIYAFSDMHYLEIRGFIGLGNFAKIIRDPAFWNSLKVSFLYFGLSMIIVIPFSMLLAKLLSLNIKFRNVFRTIIFLPWVLSQTVVALIWMWLLNGNFGPLSWIVRLLGYANTQFLSDTTFALGAIVIANVWNSYPLAVVFMMAAIHSIPEELHEAARVDGANVAQIFTKITLPLIKPTLTVVLIQLTLLYLNMVTLIFVMTGGGPLQATRTLSLYTFEHAFHDWNTSYAASLTLILALINLGLCVLYVTVFGKERMVGTEQKRPVPSS